MSFVGIVVGFSWLGVYTPDKWLSGCVLYIIGRELPLLPLPCYGSNCYSGLFPNMLDILGRCVSPIHTSTAP